MAKKEVPLETVDLVEVPASEVSEQERVDLAFDYQDDVPIMIAGNGTALPASIGVLDETGKPVGTYTLNPVIATKSVAAEGMNWFGDPMYHFLEPITKPIGGAAGG